MPGLAEILDENARLRQQLAELEAARSALSSALAERDAMLEAVQRKAEYLAQQLELQRLQQAGPKSKRYVPDAAEQGQLPFDATFAPPPRAPVPEPQRDEEPGETQPKHARKRGKPRRRQREDLDHLRSVPVVCEATDALCARCHQPLKVIGQAESFRVEWVPGHFVRHDIRRDKCACPRCPDQGVLTVPGPYALDRAMVGNRLLARVLVDKFADHVPANRQARRMKREGFDVGSHTLSSWICRSAGLLDRVADAVRAELLAQPVLQGDDTGMPVQDGGDGSLRKGRMWAFTDQHQVFYAFTDTKQGVFPAQLLERFAGDVLLVDGGSEFNQVVRERDIERAGCWSHLRTYFHDARHHHPTEAQLALGTLRDLFVIERELWRQPPDVVLDGRQQRSLPLVDGFFAWAKAASQITRPDSTLGKAFGYAVRQEPRMRVFLERGDVPMHNNLSELMLRQPVVGRKNWLFARSEGGARAAATVYTLVGSCMLQDIDPETYLCDVFDRLLDHPARDIAALTPQNWRRAREPHTEEAR
jgi:transposase